MARYKCSNKCGFESNSLADIDAHEEVCNIAMDDDNLDVLSELDDAFIGDDYDDYDE